MQGIMVMSGKFIPRSHFDTAVTSIMSISARALEIDAKRIAPELVATYLTLPHVSKYLESKNQGKVIRTISLESILSLEISVPDSETQQKLSELLSLISEEYAVIAKEEKRLADLKCAAYSMYLEGA